MSSEPPRTPRPARIQDVAAASGVSTATVSNVLNRPGRVGPETTAKVLRVIEELDYLPHPGAAGLRRSHGSTIGLVIPDVTNRFYARIAAGAGDAAFRHGMALTLCHSGDNPLREQDYFSLLAEQRAAGVVVAPRLAGPPRLDRLRRRGIPLVVTDRTVPVESGCSVGVDDVEGSRRAVEHLLATAPGPLLVVNGAHTIRQCADRWAGAVRAVTGTDVPLREVVVADMTTRAGITVGRSLDPLPSGILCTNDFLADGMLRGLQERGVDVPERVRIVGYGDLDPQESSPISLTTVRQAVEDLGHAAVDLLVDELEDPVAHTHSTRVLLPELIVRESAPAG